MTTTAPYALLTNRLLIATNGESPASVRLPNTRSISPLKTSWATTTRSASSDKLQRHYVVADFYFFFHNHLVYKTYSYVCSGSRTRKSFSSTGGHHCPPFIFIGQFIWRYDFVLSLWQIITSSCGANWISDPTCVDSRGRYDFFFFHNHLVL